MSRLVIFDIDRTIYDGSIFLDFSLHLIQKDLISPKFLSSIGFEFFTYQTGFESYDELVRDCLNYFFNEVKHLEIEVLKKELKECLFKNHHKFYDFTFQILKKYPEYDYLLISLEPDFITEEVANFLKINKFLSNKFIEGKEFVKNPEFSFDKKQMLNDSKFREENPFAVFGDSESDFSLLLISENKFIINPTAKLLQNIEGKNLPVFNQNNIWEEIRKVF